jgi:RNA polymerase sigma factor (sigma-70 family)
MAKPQVSPVLRHIRHLIGASPATGLTDEELLNRFVAGRDEDAFEILVRRYGPLVLGVCRRVLGDAHAAEDVFQAAFLVLVRKAPSLDRRKPLGNWLYTVAYRLALTARANAARRREREAQAALTRCESVVQSVHDELSVALDEELNRLPEKHRAPLVLCYLEGKTNEQAAQALGCPKGSMSWRLAQARELLRERLVSRGYVCPAAGMAALLAAATVSSAVPLSLLENTMKAGLWFAADGATKAVCISAEALTLAKGALNTMMMSKLKLAAAVLLTVGLLGSGGTWFVQSALVAQEPAAESAQVAPESTDKESPTTAAAGDSDRLPAGTTARMGSAQFRHGDAIFFVAYLPDGKSLITASKDQTIRAWDAATGKELRRFERSTDPRKKGPAEDDDALEKEINKAVENQGLAKGLAEALREMKREFQVALSRDGKYLAATKGSTVFVWEATSGKKVHELREQRPLSVQSLTFSADGKSLFTAGPNQSVTVWDLATGKSVRQFGDQGQGNILITMGGGGAAVVSPDGKYLAWPHFEPQNQSSSLKVKDLLTGKEVSEIKAPLGGVQGLTFSPDSKTLAWGTFQEGVQLWDVAGGKEPRRLGQAQPQPLRQDITSLCFAPDGKTLAVSRPDHTIQVWEVASGTLARQIGESPPQGRMQVRIVVKLGPESASPVDLAFSPDGKTLAAGLGGASIRQFETATGKEIPPPGGGHQTAVSNCHVSPDGKTLTTCARGDAVRTWDLATGKELRQVRLPSNGGPAALSRDGRWLATVNAGAVELWEVATRKQVHKLEAGKLGVAVLALSPDGKTLATKGPYNPEIHLWDTATGKELRSVGGGNNPGNAAVLTVTEAAGVLGSEMVFAPDGKYLAGAGAKGQLCLWEVATGNSLWELSLPSDQVVERLAFSADGRSLATMSREGTITLYEVATSEKRCRLGKSNPKLQAGGMSVMIGGAAINLNLGKSDTPVSVAFSPTGRYLAASNDEPSIRLWDLITGQELGRLQGHQGSITSLAFTPDGQRLISGSLDTTALVWDVSKRLTAETSDRQLEAKTLETLWSELGSKDGTKAFEALRQLSRHPGQTARFVRDHLQPAAAPDAQRLAQLIADLDSKQFAVRRKAEAELEKLGDLAEPALRNVLKGDGSLEVRQRVERLLQKLSGPTAGGNLVRDVRAVELLELMGGKEARQALETLAKGAEGARLTKEAKAALERLAQQPTTNS